MPQAPPPSAAPAAPAPGPPMPSQNYGYFGGPVAPSAPPQTFVPAPPVPVPYAAGLSHPGSAYLGPPPWQPASGTKWNGLERKWWIAIAAGVVGVLILANSHGSSRHTISGTTEVHDSSAYDFSDGDGCVTTGGYSDVSEGTEVIITDGSGAQIASGSLGSGSISGGACVFSFTVSVPDTTSYGVRVGTRNTLSYSRSELESRSWELTLTLGLD